MSLSTDRFKTNRSAVTAPCRLRHRVSRHALRSSADRSAASRSRNRVFARLKHLLLAAPSREARGLKLIKEDHFACTTRMFEILAEACKQAPGSCCPGHASTPTRPSSHPRGFRLFTCQRAMLLKSYVSYPYRVRRRSTFFSRRVRFRPERRSCPAEGGGIISSTPPLSIGSPEEFSSPFRASRKDSQTRDLRREPALIGGCQKELRTATCDPDPTSPQFNHQGRSEIEWKEQPSPTQREHLSSTSRRVSSRDSDFVTDLVTRQRCVDLSTTALIPLNAPRPRG